jgi:hypothetical protein
MRALIRHDSAAVCLCIQLRDYKPSNCRWMTKAEQREEAGKKNSERKEIQND